MAPQRRKSAKQTCIDLCVRCVFAVRDSLVLFGICQTGEDYLFEFGIVIANYCNHM